MDHAIFVKLLTIFLHKNPIKTPYHLATQQQQPSLIQFLALTHLGTPGDTSAFVVSPDKHIFSPPPPNPYLPIASSLYTPSLLAYARAHMLPSPLLFRGGGSHIPAAALAPVRVPRSAETPPSSAPSLVIRSLFARYSLVFLYPSLPLWLSPSSLSIHPIPSASISLS